MYGNIDKQNENDRVFVGLFKHAIDHVYRVFSVYMYLRTFPTDWNLELLWIRPEKPTLPDFIHFLDNLRGIVMGGLLEAL